MFSNKGTRVLARNNGCIYNIYKYTALALEHHTAKYTLSCSKLLAGLFEWLTSNFVH